MSDRENVIRKLQDALEEAEGNGKLCAEVRRPIVFNAITMLKEQDKLEKWNEPQPPNYGKISVYKCPKCGTEIKFLQNYCGYCRQAVKWE